MSFKKSKRSKCWALGRTAARRKPRVHWRHRHEGKRQELSVCGVAMARGGRTIVRICFLVVYREATLSSKRTVAPSTSATAVAASASAPAKPPGPRAGHQEAGDRALPGSGMAMIVGLQWEKPVTRQPGDWGILVSMQIKGSVPFGTEP